MDYFGSFGGVVKGGKEDGLGFMENNVQTKVHGRHGIPGH
jgi:hypothetical protein